MAYRLSTRAEEDLLQVFLSGLELFGLRQAELYQKEIKRVIEILSENPRLARLRPELSGEVRVHPVKSHLVVYETDNNDKDIFILRIIHCHEDWESALDESDESP